MNIKVKPPRGVREAAADLVAQIGAAGKAGVLADDLRVQQPVRSFAAQWIRQMGLPLIATRRAGHSRWWIAKANSTLANRWRTRMLEDAYVEVARAHMALKPHPAYDKDASVLAVAAMNLGQLLGRDVDQVLVDIATEPVHSSITAAMKAKP